MIICLGPICFPIWQLFPVLLLLFAKAKAIYYWAIGKEMPKDGASAKNTAEITEGSKGKRKGTGETVTIIKTVEQWKEMIEFSKNTGEPVIVDFTATWCKPCKAMAPFFEELCDRYGDIATFASVDVDELDEVSSTCGVKAMPTFQVYKGETKVAEVTGAFKDQLLKMVATQCSTEKEE